MPPPPLLGYNNNVRHRGQVFHIQTEDSGVNSPRIMTHLFADGGRIVKSTRTDYSEYVGRGDMAEVVKNLMKEQHKAMFVALRSGELDATIGFPEDAPPASVTGIEHMRRATEQMERDSIRAPSAGVDADAVAADAREAEAASSERAASSRPGRESRPADESRESSGSFPAAPKVPTSTPGRESEKPYAAPRPASIFSGAAPVTNLFGDVGGLDEKSLDDAILSYLAEDTSKDGAKK